MSIHPPYNIFTPPALSASFNASLFLVFQVLLRGPFLEVLQYKQLVWFVHAYLSVIGIQLRLLMI